MHVFRDRWEQWKPAPPCDVFRVEIITTAAVCFCRFYRIHRKMTTYAPGAVGPGSARVRAKGRAEEAERSETNRNEESISWAPATELKSSKKLFTAGRKCCRTFFGQIMHGDIPISIRSLIISATRIRRRRKFKLRNKYSMRSPAGGSLSILNYFHYSKLTESGKIFAPSAAVFGRAERKQRPSQRNEQQNRC